MNDIGFNFIKEMTKDDLIEEIISHQRALLEKQELSRLRVQVIEYRVQDYKNRLSAEAGVVPTILGYLLPDEEETNE